MAYQHRELIHIDTNKNIESQCQDILTNWEIVCEENDYHRAYVSNSNWDMWMSFRKKVDSDIVSLSTKNIGDIHDYLTSLNDRIMSSTRRDVKREYDERQEIERQRREEEMERNAMREAKPSQGLLSRLLKWR